MASALPRACPAYGCHHRAPCPLHGRKAQQKAKDDRRGSASSRGYGARWRAHVEAYRAELQRLNIGNVCGARHPSAPQTQDSDCAKAGRLTFGRVVDHIIPTTGPNDPAHYDRANHQLLCDGVSGYGCHDRKRQREQQQALGYRPRAAQVTA